MSVEKKESSVYGARKGPNLRALAFSPERNPLIEAQKIPIKRRYVSTGIKRDMADTSSGEIIGASVIRTVEEKDDEQFVKVFSDGIKAAFGLSRTGHRVFQVVLDAYQKEPMKGGFSEAVYLAWFDGGLSGQAIGMTDRTFQLGLRELLEKGFISPKSPNLFWVNPALFFKGDRVLFVREYVRGRAIQSLNLVEQK